MKDGSQTCYFCGIYIPAGEYYVTKGKNPQCLDCHNKETTSSKSKYYDNPPAFGCGPYPNSLTALDGQMIVAVEVISDVGDNVDSDGNNIIEIRALTDSLTEYELISFFPLNKNVRVMWTNGDKRYPCKVVEMHLKNFEPYHSYIRALIQKKDLHDDCIFNEAEMEIIRKS